MNNVKQSFPGIRQFNVNGDTKSSPGNRRRKAKAIAVVAAAVTLMGGAIASASTGITWDASGTNPTAPTDGSGTWTKGTGSNWSNGSTDAVFSTSDFTQNVAFGDNGTAGTVTISGYVAVANFTLNALTGTNNAYTIGGGTLYLGNNASTCNLVNNNTDGTTTINSVINDSGTGGTLNLSGAGNTTFTAAMNHLTLIDGDSGTLTLSGTNAFTGGTTINAGTLAASFATANLGGGTNPAVIVNNTGTLTLSGAAATDAAAITLAGGSTLNLTTTSGATSILSQALQVTGTTTINLSHTGTNYQANAFLLNSTTPVNVTINGGGGSSLGPGWTIGGAGSGALAAGSTLTFNGDSTAGNTYNAGNIYISSAAGRAELANTDVTIGSTDSTAGMMFAFGNGGAGTVQFNSLAGGTSALTAMTSDNAATIVQINNGTVAGANFAGSITNGAGSGPQISVIKNGSGTQIFSGAGTNYTGTTTVNGGTLTLQGLTAYASATTINASGSLLLIYPSLSTFQFFNPVVSGTGALTIGATNANRLILNSAWPAFTGNIEVQSGGIFEPRSELSAGTGNSVTVDAGGELRIQFSATSIDALNGAGTVDSVSGAATLTVGQAGGSGSFTGVLKDNGSALSFTKTGTGTETLSGVNAYSGPTTISGGTLQIASNGSLGAGSYAGAIPISSGALLEYSSSAAQIVSGIISGSGTLTKDTSAASTLTLSGANTSFAGGATISAGTLLLNTSLSAAGTGTITLNDANTGSSNTTLQMGVGGSTVTWGNTITVAAQGSGTTTIQYVPASSGFVWTTGTITLNGPGTITAPAMAGVCFFGSTLSGNGTLTVGSTNNNRFLLNNSSADDNESAFTGNIVVAAGAVLEPRAALSSATGNTVTVDSDGILQIVFADTSIDALNGAGTVQSNFSDSLRTLTVGKSNGSGTFSGTIQNNSGTLALTKSGGGTQVLSGTNTYSGGTTISNGILLANNATSSTGTGAVNVTTAGVLGGNGKINNTGGAVTISSGSSQTTAGMIAPGTPFIVPTATLTGSPYYNIGAGATDATATAICGNLTIAGNLTLQGGGGGGTYYWKVDTNTGNQDQITIDGTLNITTGANLFNLAIEDFGTSVAAQSQTYIIANAASITVNGSAISLGDVTSDFAVSDNLDDTWTVQAVSGGLGEELEVTGTVPEPCSLGLLGIAAIGLLRRRRTVRKG